MTADGDVAPDDVAATARLAGLPLGEDRRVAVADLLSAWVPAANALGARMRAPELDGLMPAVVFAQPGAVDEEAGT